MPVGRSPRSAGGQVLLDEIVHSQDAGLPIDLIDSMASEELASATDGVQGSIRVEYEADD